MNGELCERLNLDATVVLHHGTAYRGLARALAGEREAELEPQRLQRMLMEAADRDALCSHYFAIASGYLGLIDPAGAAECLHEAARWAAYRSEALSRPPAAPSEERRPDTRPGVLDWRLRAMLLSAAGGGDIEHKDWIGELVERAEPHHPSVGHELLLILMRGALGPGEEGIARELLRAVSDRFARQRSAPVGTLRIPLDFTLRLAGLISERVTEDAPQLLEWGSAFGQRLQERVAIAQSSPRHWRQLYIRLLPVEPDALLAVGTWLQLSRLASDRARLLNQIRGEFPAMYVYTEVARRILRLGE